MEKVLIASTPTVSVMSLSERLLDWPGWSSDEQEGRHGHHLFQHQLGQRERYW